MNGVIYSLLVTGGCLSIMFGLIVSLKFKDTQSIKDKSQENSWDLSLGMVKTIPKKIRQIFIFYCIVYTM